MWCGSIRSGLVRSRYKNGISTAITTNSSRPRWNFYGPFASMIVWFGLNIRIKNYGFLYDLKMNSIQKMEQKYCNWNLKSFDTRTLRVLYLKSMNNIQKSEKDEEGKKKMWIYQMQKWNNVNGIPNCESQMVICVHSHTAQHSTAQLSTASYDCFRPFSASSLLEQIGSFLW